MRRVVIATVLAGCSAGPAHFDAVRSGSYECTADVVTNTCGLSIPTSSRRVEVDGGTDLLSLLAPSDGALANAPFEPPWSSIQFGAGAGDPDVVEGSGSAACDTGAQHHLYSFVIRAEVTRAASDELVIDLLYDYSDIAACVFTSTPVDACQLAWTVRCVPEP